MMTTPPSPLRYGLEQARAQLPHIASEAHAGYASVITRHGKPVAVVVPVAQWEQAQPPSPSSAGPGLLALRGSGRGLWGADVAGAVADLRDEWERG
jgi:prevent-host-death family protein